MKLRFERLQYFELPLTQSLVIRPGVQIKKRCLWLLFYRDENSQQYVGECAPLEGVHQESKGQLADEIETFISGYGNFFEISENKNLLQWDLPFFGLTSFPVLSPALMFGLEQILWQLIFLNPEIYTVNLKSLKWKSEISGLIHLDASDLEDQLDRIKQLACRTIKIKVGRQPLSHEINLILKILNQLDGSCRLRLDGNESLSLQEIERLARELPLKFIEYLEEPFRSRDDWKHYRGPFRIARDESLWDLNPMDEEINSDEVLILKPSRLGISRTIAWLQKVPHTQVVLSSCYESGVGLRQIAQLAAFFKLPLALGLDTYRYLAADVHPHRLDWGPGTLILDFTEPHLIRLC